MADLLFLFVVLAAAGVAGAVWSACSGLRAQDRERIDPDVVVFQVHRTGVNGSEVLR